MLTICFGIVLCNVVLHFSEIGLVLCNNVLHFSQIGLVLCNDAKHFSEIGMVLCNDAKHYSEIGMMLGNAAKHLSELFHWFFTKPKKHCAKKNALFIAFRHRSTSRMLLFTKHCLFLFVDKTAANEKPHGYELRDRAKVFSEGRF